MGANVIPECLAATREGDERKRGYWGHARGGDSIRHEGHFSRLRESKRL